MGIPSCRGLTGQTAQEAAVAGMAADATAGGVLTATGPDVSTGSPEIDAALDTYQVVGGVQAVGLSTALTTGLYGTGATVSSACGAAALPLSISLLGGYMVGDGINSLYTYAFDGNASIGTHIYELFNDDSAPFNDHACGCE